MSEFIFMLTHNDSTVPDAVEVWRSLERSALKYVGFKDVGIDGEARKRLVDAIHASGRPVMLEVVSESRDEELRAVASAAELGIEYLLGGTRAKDVAPLAAAAGIRYFPFPGRVTGHPSTLEGTLAEIVESAVALASTDAVAGLDLLAYRHRSEPEAVAAAVIQAVDAPVVIAGSVATAERVRRVSEMGAWGFTVGSALFEGAFGGSGDTLRRRVDAVLEIAADTDGHRD
jgi:NAD(P)H-dependent flavin oxidoreductase YrpB (nitropropane dioxygenase family)